jgi:hypothetical protein
VKVVSTGFLDGFLRPRMVSIFEYAISHTRKWKLSAKPIVNSGVSWFPCPETFQNVETNGFHQVSFVVSLLGEGEQ